MRLSSPLNPNRQARFILGGAAALAILALVVLFAGSRSVVASRKQAAEQTVFLAAGASEPLQDVSNCVSVYDVKRGDSCNSQTSISFRLKNICSQLIDMKYCAQRSDGRWSCGVWTNTKPNESTSWYICDGTGEYRWSAVITGGNTRLPADPTE